jgi:hypothetical protein
MQVERPLGIVITEAVKDRRPGVEGVAALPERGAAPAGKPVLFKHNGRKAALLQQRSRRQTSDTRSNDNDINRFSHLLHFFVESQTLFYKETFAA